MAGPQNPRPTIPRAAFVASYIRGSGTVPAELVLEWRQPRRCRCEYEGCSGWQMLPVADLEEHDERVRRWALDRLRRGGRRGRRLAEAQSLEDHAAAVAAGYEQDRLDDLAHEEAIAVAMSESEWS